jgi:PAS domain S-box-containing protein
LLRPLTPHRRRAVGALLAAAAAAGTWAWFALRPAVSRDVVYKIGWGPSPPFQVAMADGSPGGISVDLVRLAARRRGIQLQWVRWQDSSESALRSHSVDLWPLITITLERLRAFHISQPYLEHEYCLLVRGDSPHRTADTLATATVSLANPSIDVINLRRRLPNARPVVQTSLAAVMADVCQQRADAGFTDSYSAVSAILDGGGCGATGLRWIALPQIRSRLGVGSTFEARAAADAIREEIGAIATEGKLADILGQWGYMSGRHLEAMEELLDSQRREVRLLSLSAIFAMLFVLACLQSVRVMRERDRTRRMQYALAEAEGRLRLMANNLTEMVLAFDMNRRLIFANPALETLTGYSAAELERGFVNWIHPDDQARMMGHWDGLFRGASYRDEQYRLVTKDGSVKWASASWGPILDAAGRQVGVLGTERDITDRKQAEDALRESQERYAQSQKLESIGRLAGGVAHDFNNLLTVILGYSSMVLAKLAKDNPDRHWIEEIRHAGTCAADLTQQLLAFSRKQLIQPRPIDLNTVVTESDNMFRRLLGEDIQLVTNLDPSLGAIMADAGQMHQVLMNLLANARDAMPGGGRLLIETGNVEIDRAFVAVHNDAVQGPAVVLTVADSGQGMDRETTRHIFEPFFTTKGPSQGTGLGLATVYGIVKQSQGWIAVESEPGQGTAFRIYFPRLAASAEPEPPVGERGAAPAAGSATLLVVEDQHEVRALAVRALTSRGYRVLQADSAEAALDQVQAHTGPLDLLFTDVVLSGMNGKELAERLLEIRPAVKIVFTSGYTEDVIAHHGVIDQNVAYLGKPYTPESMLDKITEVLARA